MKVSRSRASKFGTKKPQEVLKKSRGRCWYCGKRLQAPTYKSGFPDNPKAFSIDHFVPTSKGGTSSLKNLIPACTTCNIAKSNGDLDYLRLQMLIRQEHWPKFNIDQYEFLLSRGINLGKLGVRTYKFFFEIKGWT